MMDIVSIGFGSVVMTSKIMAIVPPDSAPIKRLVTDARRENRLLDATYGRRTRSVLLMDNGMIILSAITPETISMRALDESLKGKKELATEEEI